MSRQEQLLKITDQVITLWKDGRKETCLRILETLPPVASAYVSCRLYGAQLKIPYHSSINQEKGDQLLTHLIERSELFGWMCEEKLRELLSQLNRLISSDPMVPR